jgi:hypothetical protein
MNPPVTPTTATRFAPASTGYKRGWALFFGLFPLATTPLWVLAWLEPEPPGGWPFLPLVILVPAGGLFVLARLWNARLAVDVDGRLVRRSMVRQRAGLADLETVALSPSLPYPDQKRHEQFEGGRDGYATKYAYDVIDADGDRVQIAPRYLWRDEQPVLAQVAAAVDAGGGRCEPVCWQLLHRDLEVEVPPVPPRLLEPQSWDTPLHLRAQNESAAMNPTRAAVGLGAVPQVVWGFFAVASEDPVGGLITLATGLLTVGIGLALVQHAVRRARQDVVQISAEGRLRSVSRRAWSANRLGYRLIEGSVDLRNLRRAELVPGTRTDSDGRPGWWNLELVDHAGGAARIDLFHPREPAATLMPQLAHHLEASGTPLDQRTHRGLSMRLGRPLTHPRDT